MVGFFIMWGNMNNSVASRIAQGIHQAKIKEIEDEIKWYEDTIRHLQVRIERLKEMKNNLQ